MGVGWQEPDHIHRPFQMYFSPQTSQVVFCRCISVQCRFYLGNLPYTGKNVQFDKEQQQVGYNVIKLFILLIWNRPIELIIYFSQTIYNTILISRDIKCRKLICFQKVQISFHVCRHFLNCLLQQTTLQNNTSIDKSVCDVDNFWNTPK